MEVVARPKSLRAFVAKAFSFLLQPRWAAVAALALALLTLVLLQFAPGVPDRLRPYLSYKHWRAREFLTQGVQAQERGDLNLARLALDSALRLNPGLTPARIQLARLHAHDNRFNDAAEQARLAGMDGALFVHDMLFYSGRFDELLVHCANKALEVDTATRGVWLQSAFMIAPMATDATRAHLNRSLSNLAHPDARLLEAIVLAVDLRGQEVAQKLAARAALPGLDAAETLLGVELLIHAESPGDAWIWLQHHRAKLTEFDARCAEYRIESARDPLLARRILESLSELPLDETRWIRFVALVAAAGDRRDANFACSLLAAHQPRPSAQVAVSAWSLLLLHGHGDEAQIWDNNYKHLGGSELPLLVGRSLSEPDRQVRSRAVRLLAAQAPLPRPMIAALLLR